MVVLATADPLDPFTPAAVAAATGRRVTLEVAVPIELEAALEPPVSRIDDAAAAPTTPRPTCRWKTTPSG